MKPQSTPLFMAGTEGEIGVVVGWEQRADGNEENYYVPVVVGLGDKSDRSNIPYDRAWAVFSSEIAGFYPTYEAAADQAERIASNRLYQE